MRSLIAESATDLKAVYHKAIAEKFAYEKKLIVRELQKHGIQAVLTTPQNLTVDTINKYLELKARGLI
jgi:CRISPR/Cas system-associated protein Cas7 (RAMP superfamily)